MAAIPLTNITIPTPAEYNSSDPTKQQENFYYVLNQILTTAKSAGESVDLNLAEIITSISDLTFTGERIELPALGMVLQKIGKTLTIYEL